MNNLPFDNFFPEEVTALFLSKEHDFICKGAVWGFSKQQAENLKPIVDPLKVFNIKQVHGNEVLVAKAGDTGGQDADAAITNDPDVILAIRTADCLPGFLYDPVNKAIGIVHAGWKSTAKKIMQVTVDKMIEIYGTDPKDIMAAFGPCIRPCCCEVTDEMKEVFKRNIEEKEGKYYLDIGAENRDQLLESGVTKIYDCGECTCCNENYFSFRRQGDKSGRHLSLIMLKG